MKCVCPMGGDRTCPDSCLVGAWHTLPDDQKTKVRRLPIVEALTKQGYTQEVIALQLGVSQNTISRDLEGLSTVDKPHRPKGGRPKGTKAKGGGMSHRRAARRNDNAASEAAAKLVLDEGLSNEEAGKKTGAGSELLVRIAVAREEGRREPQVSRDGLAMTAQQKYDAAIKQATRRLEVEIEHKVRVENLKWLQRQLDQHNENARHYEAVLKARKGFMDKTAYNLIWSCLHADSRKSASDDKLNRAFHLWTSLEKVALSEKDSPTRPSGLPKNAEELLKRKAEYDAQRAAQRAAKKGSANVQRRA